jgi:hypothetical protein
MRFTVTPLLAAALFAAAAHAQAPNMKEGLWEITSRMDMPGMPAGMPPQTVRQCLTRKDIDNPQRMAPTGQQDNRCQVSDYRLQGNTATWNWSCKGGEEVSGSGSMTFSGASYTGVTKVTMRQGGKAQTMTMHFDGRHVGACK